MFKKSGLLTFYAETSLHMGSGTSLSYVDLPIQREKHTDFPIMQASGIKGVMKEFAERKWYEEVEKRLNSQGNPEEAKTKTEINIANKEKIYEAIKTKVSTIFGPEEGDKFASCIVFTDAKILLFPVRSVSGIFAWMTSPFVLKRFKRDLESAGIEFKDNNEEIDIPEPSGEEKIIVANSILKVQSTNQVMLEEFVFDVEDGKSEEADKIANKIKEFLPENPAFQDLINELPKRFCIVADNVFKDFVKLAVEIQTRIKINQATGTVEEGALFTEELVPSESVFYSLVFFNDPYNKINGLQNVDDVMNTTQNLFSNFPLLQLGGDETLGRGLLRVKFTQGK